MKLIPNIPNYSAIEKYEMERQKLYILHKISVDVCSEVYECNYNDKKIAVKIMAINCCKKPVFLQRAVMLL